MSQGNPFSGYYSGTPQQAYQQGQQSGQQQGQQQEQQKLQNAGTAWGGATSGTTGTIINDPMVNPNAYQYGGQAGGAQAFNSQLQGLAAAQAQQQGAQIQNQYDPRDQAQMQGVLGQLGGFYAGQLNGTGPSLANLQAQGAMEDSIQAQMAAANSARGGLSGAAAQMGAAQNAATAQQNAAYNAMQGRIQEEYNAAQGMQGVGQLSLGEQQANMQNAQMQAQLQQSQQDINAKMGLGYSGLENQVNEEQLNAQMQQQAQMSSNYLGASGMGMQQSQFNTTNNENLAMGGLGAAAGLMMLAADADFVEPRGADARPAWDTLREQRTVDGHPFIAIADRNTGVVEKLATKPLSPAEARRVAEPHGAGPLFADGAARAHTTFHDMPMITARPTLGPRGFAAPAPTTMPMARTKQTAAPAPMPNGAPAMMALARSTLGPRGLAAPPAMAGTGGVTTAPRPAPGGGGMVAPPPAPGGGAMRAAPPGLMAAPPAMMRPAGGPLIPSFGMTAPQMPGAGRRVADMDLSGVRRQTYHDAGLGDPTIQAGLANLDYGDAGGGGGTFLDQLRAKEAGDISAATPPGGYTFAQQRFYPGANGLGAQPQGLTSDQAAQAFGGNGPAAGSIAGRAVATGGYGQGWDLAHASAPAAAGAPPSTSPSKMHQAGMDLMRSGLSQMRAAPPAPYSPGGYAGGAIGSGFTPMAVPSFNPYADADLGGGFPDEHAQMYGLLGSAQVADMDLHPQVPRAYARPSPHTMTAGMAGIHEHMRRLQAADADLKAKLGSGKRFSHLEHQLAGRGAKDPGALAAYIGREKYGAHKMAHLAAAHRG